MRYILVCVIGTKLDEYDSMNAHFSYTKIFFTDRSDRTRTGTSVSIYIKSNILATNKASNKAQPNKIQNKGISS